MRPMLLRRADAWPPARLGVGSAPATAAAQPSAGCSATTSVAGDAAIDAASYRRNAFIAGLLVWTIKFELTAQVCLYRCGYWKQSCTFGSTRTRRATISVNQAQFLQSNRHGGWGDVEQSRE